MSMDIVMKMYRDLLHHKRGHFIIVSLTSSVETASFGPAYMEKSGPVHDTLECTIFNLIKRAKKADYAVRKWVMQSPFLSRNAKFNNRIII